PGGVVAGDVQGLAPPPPSGGRPVPRRAGGREVTPWLVPRTGPMTATVSILRGPAGSGKTTRLLERCRDAFRGPGPVLRLAPTRRRAAQLSAALATVCPSPLLSTFQDLGDELAASHAPRARPLSRAQRRLVVDEVVSELHDRGELGHFARVLDTRGF